MKDRERDRDNDRDRDRGRDIDNSTYVPFVTSNISAKGIAYNRQGVNVA